MPNIICAKILRFIIILRMMNNSKVIKPKKKTTTQIICENLGLAYQTIFQDYKCTLKGNFSYFGRLYIGEDHLMFVSNMFGIVKKIAIVIDTISKINQPTAGTIVINGKHHKSVLEEQFCFHGFKNQNAFKIIRALWKKEKLSSEVLNSNEEQTENSQKSTGSKSLDDANVEVNMFNPEKVQTQLQKMFQIILPCSVDQFYHFFLADDANVYSRAKHLQLKQSKDIVVTPWKQNAQTNAQVRQIVAQMKLKGVPFRSYAPMTQVWLLSKKTSEELTLKLITQMSQIPYTSYFYVEEQISVVRQTDGKCKCTCNTGIVFNKATTMKGMILSRTFEDLQLDYKLWCENVKQVLDKMKKKQQEQIKAQKNKSSINVQFEQHKVESETYLKDTTYVEKEYLVKEMTNLNNKIDGLIKLGKAIIVIVAFSLLLNVYQATR